MKKMFFAAAVITVAFFSSCSPAGGDPKAVLNNFFEALSKKDIAGARKLATEDSKSMLDMMEMAMKMSKDSSGNNEFEKYGKDKVELGEAKIEGDKATVAVKDKSSGESTNFSLKKEKNDWKVAFDKSSVMQMGMDKMKEKGVDPVEGINKLNEINPDSLGDKVKEGVDKMKEGVDQATKELEKLKENK
jgi:Domain of unknown function (DUF4878)